MDIVLVWCEWVLWEETFRLFSMYINQQDAQILWLDFIFH